MSAFHLRSLRHSLFAALAAAVLFCVVAYAQVRLDVPYVQTPQHVVDRMLAIANVNANDLVMDLGSGDGRTPITAAKKYGARGLGVDIDPRRIAEANENARKAGVTDRVTFRQQDLFDTPIGEATVLTMYLLQSVNLKLRPRILKDMRPGARVVSHSFHMGDWAPDQHENLDGHDVYLWIVPANVDGRWRLTLGEKRIDLRLNQKYQKVTGSASVDGRMRQLESVTLRGDQISFVLNTGDGRKQFNGRVAGDTIEPADSASAGERSGASAPAGGWRATRG